LRVRSEGTDTGTKQHTGEGVKGRARVRFYLGRRFGVAGGDDGAVGHALGVVLRCKRHEEVR